MTLPRTVKLGMRGFDVEAHGRAMHRYLGTGQLNAFNKQSDLVRRGFGVAKRTLAKKAAAKANLPQYGIVGPALHAKLWAADAYDAKAIDLLKRYTESLKPKLVEPRQGWGSLHPSLWKAYSEGRNRGFSDLGTYNPASLLPSGAKSDHAFLPALAFDLGISPQTGWQHVKARAYVYWLMKFRKDVRYVILGDRIWYQGSLRSYSSGGHQNHVHCSGWR